MTDVRDSLMVGRASDGKLVQRPLSPHLQAYRMVRLTSALSIFHRITGVIIGFGTVFMVWWLVAAATSDQAYAWVMWIAGSPFGYLVLFGWTATLWYHFFNGIRHMTWDVGIGFEMPAVYASGKMMLAATAVFTVLTWVVGLAAL
jgi:succinate dehydrogenase / fumarate reductase cytochrome b subunit